jgi:5-formyltetrahydrofolate cyclo-ligase
MIDTDKARLRIEARARRRLLAADAGAAAEAAQYAAEHFLNSVFCNQPCVMAGYIAMADELDPLPLMRQLAAAGHRLALPVVVEKQAPLKFRAWQPGGPLEAGHHGTQAPPAAAPEVTPDVVIVPLLAFDAAGHRLGYGGGYYDRTLAQLRRQGRVQAVGFAYDGQKVPALPCHEGDQRLDAIVTDQAVYWFQDQERPAT